MRSIGHFFERSIIRCLLINRGGEQVEDVLFEGIIMEAVAHGDPEKIGH